MFKRTLLLILAASACGDEPADPPAPTSAIKTIVLVHGAFADGSSWDRVMPILEKQGYEVVSVHQPLSSLAEDVAATNRAIEIATGPVLLVGHSYGGFVITEAGNSDKVMGLVYIAAFAPDNGESITELFADKPAPEWTKTAKVDSGGFAWLPRATVATLFAQDLPDDDIDLLTAKQGPLALRVFDDHLGVAAWRTRPSWFVIPAHDLMIPAEAQTFMAQRAGSQVTNLDSSHVVMLSHADEVAGVILAAADEIE